MIPAPTCKPIFHYAFRPLACRQHPNDGGFTVTMFPDDRLCFSIFGAGNVRREMYWFQLPSNTRMRYFEMLDHSDWWLRDVPQTLRQSTNPMFSSFFGYDQHVAFIASDLPLLVQRPCNDQIGHYARHLYALFEDVTDLFAPLGLRLQLDSFTWDQTRVTPLSPEPPVEQPYSPDVAM